MNTIKTCICSSSPSSPQNRAHHGKNRPTADGCCVLHSVDAEKPAYMASQVRQEVHDDREDRLQRGPYALVLARWQRKWSSSAWRGRGAASRDGVVSCGGEEQRPRRGSGTCGKGSGPETVRGCARVRKKRRATAHSSTGSGDGAGTMRSGMRRRRLEGTAEELQVQRGGTRALAHGGRAAGVSSFRRLRLPGGETAGRRRAGRRDGEARARRREGARG